MATTPHHEETPSREDTHLLAAAANASPGLLHHPPFEGHGTTGGHGGSGGGGNTRYHLMRRNSSVSSGTSGSPHLSPRMENHHHYHHHPDPSSPSSSMALRRSSRMAMAVAELLKTKTAAPPLQEEGSQPTRKSDAANVPFSETATRRDSKRDKTTTTTAPSSSVVEQSVAVVLVALLNLMISIPFGVSYFPIEWNANFPVQDQAALGIRMFLFATFAGQVVFSFFSKFPNAISLQMVENVPFCHALAAIVMAHQGQGREALSTLLILFGLSSVAVGLTFYALGRLQWGRIVYFFPSHVLVGCISGIGIFIIVTALEVTTNQSIDQWHHHLPLLMPVVLLEAVLRLLQFLTKDPVTGQARFTLLAPLYFFAITPVFYALVGMLPGVHISDLSDYFFPPIAGTGGSDAGGGANAELSALGNLWEMWTLLHFPSFSWSALRESIPTLLALVAFSLIHVPINIPAFALSTNVEVDMNAELIAHGYSNALSGMLGGIQNYMTYSNSVLYAKSGGHGKVASLAIAAMTAVLFVVGPAIASYIPRCMAGTLLIHIGIDLFLEGVYDSYGNFDYLEYAGIWIITLVMTIWGMTAAILAGILSALSTFAAQSITYTDPIRGSMSASTLRSSAYNRPPAAQVILNKERSQILVIQLQGHIFFGNVVGLTEKLTALFEEKQGTNEEPLIVIIDFSLVVGMDSSAAQAIAKFKKTMHQKFHIRLAIFVTGSEEGFRTEYNLSGELMKETSKATPSPSSESTQLLSSPRPSMVDFRSSLGPSVSLRALAVEDDIHGNADDKELGMAPPSKSALADIPSNHVCESLDSALILAENVLVALHDPNLLEDDLHSHTQKHRFCPQHAAAAAASAVSLVSSGPARWVPSKERQLALHFLGNLCPEATLAQLEQLFSYWERQTYQESDVLWREGSTSDCAKLLLEGMLLSEVENEAVEYVHPGAMFGELGLVNGTERLSTVRCKSSSALVYHLSSRQWDVMQKNDPVLARLVDRIVIRYLATRVQHVSNRIFETRCLPI